MGEVAIDTKRNYRRLQTSGEIFLRFLAAQRASFVSILRAMPPILRRRISFACVRPAGMMRA